MLSSMSAHPTGDKSTTIEPTYSNTPPRHLLLFIRGYFPPEKVTDPKPTS